MTVYKFLAPILLSFFPCALAAQSDEEMARVFEWQFSMTAPDTSFVPLDGASGWEEPATQAKVVCIATPAPFERLMEDLSTLSAEAGQKILEKRNVELGGQAGVLLLLEISPVAGEDTAVVYSLLFARPLEKAVLIVDAQYPRSEHGRLYPKMLAAFATVRKKD